MTREEIYRLFGPLLIEAVILIIRDEINILRISAGMTERTNQQIIDALETKINSLIKYNWMHR